MAITSLFMPRAFNGDYLAHGRYSLHLKLSLNVDACFDKMEGKTVVLKRLPKSSDNLSELMRNVRAIRDIGEHPHIVKLYNVLDNNSYMIHVYEHMKYGDLAGYIRPNGLEGSICIDVLKQIASGINHMHNLGYVHRDIKPDNIGVAIGSGERMLVKIIDLQQVTCVTENFKKAVGSTPYMAPELLETKSNTLIDLKLCDSWSLGIVLYILLSGCFPWAEARSTCPKFMDKLQSAEYPLFEPNTSLGDSCPRMMKLLRMLLAVNVTDRWSIDDTVKYLSTHWPFI